MFFARCFTLVCFESKKNVLKSVVLIREKSDGKKDGQAREMLLVAQRLMKKNSQNDDLAVVPNMKCVPSWDGLGEARRCVC